MVCPAKTYGGKHAGWTHTASRAYGKVGRADDGVRAVNWG